MLCCREYRVCYHFATVLLLAHDFGAAVEYGKLSVELPVPSEDIAVNSTKGFLMLAESAKSGHAESYRQLSIHYVTQNSQSYCSIASLTMMLNAAKRPAPVAKVFSPYPYWIQDDVLKSACAASVTTPKQVNEHGLTLPHAAELASCYIHTVPVHAAQASIKKFIQTAKYAVSSTKEFMTANFQRSGLDEYGGGHFSPIAAYHESTNSFLVMDVSRYKYPPVWVNAEVLFKAMNTTDSVSGLSRGWFTISQ
ncbi:hypothetical protein CYMTET_20487 [Cymbomonas tetramitiformis]|uniref:glutathione gamma-glutamylcysteinyltransferase n=1 Tax=Cymbomonas tetramitiformis TaxID=36881 RepID=A0AAE0G5A9_9CHLO|nr:hypothetical protein CYMTET_20487 [Cymbomonas tetramitiformis]|eukprot:gene11692-13806_t